MSRLFLYEADDDQNAATNNDTAGNDNTADNNTSADDNAEQNKETTDNETQDNKDDNQNDDQTNDDENQNGDDQFNDDDFTISDDDNGGDENSGDGSNDSGIGSTSTDADNPPLDPHSLKAKDRELFDSLSIPEQQIKVKELKMLFGELYTNCNNIVDRFNSLSLEIEEVSKPIKRAMSILFDLKDMISFYILNIYDTKSYIENDIAFNRYISILNSVKNVIKEVNSGINDDNKQE